MCAQPNAKENFAASIVPPVVAMAPWRVAAVSTAPGWRLRVRFVDGLEGTVNMSGLVHSPKAGVFAALADEILFRQAYLEHGAVTWPGELDLAPDAMHAEIKARGEWTL
jgi:hypothetical protein